MGSLEAMSVRSHNFGVQKFGGSETEADQSRHCQIRSSSTIMCPLLKNSPTYEKGAGA